MKFLRGFWKLFERPSPLTQAKPGIETAEPIKVSPIGTGKESALSSTRVPESPKDKKELTDTTSTSVSSSLEVKKQYTSDPDPEAKHYKPIREPVMATPTYPTGPLIRPKREKVYLQIGIDFGTSSTKIVYSQLSKAGAHAISFNHKLPHYPDYCLPSIAAIDKSGRLLLGTEAARALANERWDKGFQRFKVIVAGNCDELFEDAVTCKMFFDYRDSCNGLESNFTAERLTAIYLAYAMNLARNYLKNLSEYQNSDLDLTFNICMPIDHIENNLVRTTFNDLFAWAEAIESIWQRKGGSFDVLNASHECEGATHDTTCRTFAVPEAVAEVASYLSSLRRREGLHAVIDFGAGTTDVSIFRLRVTAGEMVSDWYAARNIPRGTANIERMIAHHLPVNNNIGICTYCDIQQKIHYLSNDGNFSDSIKNELYDLWKSKDYSGTWGAAHKHLNLQIPWEKVEVFTCGGGASLPYIEDIFSVPWWDNLHVKYPVTGLPTPYNYDPGPSSAPFSRMAVAYGLSIPKPQLDRYILPNDVGDQTPTPLSVRELDHEVMYAR